MISKNRLYGMIQGTDDSKLTFEMQDDHFNLELGDWVTFEKNVTEFRTTAVNVIRAIDSTDFGRLLS